MGRILTVLIIFFSFNFVEFVAEVRHWNPNNQISNGPYNETIYNYEGLVVVYFKQDHKESRLSVGI